MRIRRPLAALLTALALFGGSATLTACGDPAGTDRSDGTTDDSGDQGEESGEGADDTGDGNTEENEEEGGDLPNNSDPETGQNQDDDRQDPD